MRARKLLIGFVVASCMAIGAPAVANPPDEDPTCGRGTQSGRECAGDNGGEGCRGIRQAEPFVEDTPAADAMDLVTDILSDGNEGDCEDDE